MVKMMRLRLVKYTAICLAVILVIYLGLSTYGAYAAMEIPRLPLNPEYSPASLELVYENISFASRGDKVVLKGWYLPGNKKSVFLVVHGGFQNRIDDNVDTLDLTSDLVKTGYGVLLFDLRGRGESEGKGASLSNIDRDIGGAVDYLKDKGYIPEHIYILGFCSGAASACIFASHNNVGALILDGCFDKVNNMVVSQAKAIGIPEFLTDFFLPGVFMMAKIFYGYDVINPIDIISDVTCPILFIHEENDEFISQEEMENLYNASHNPANEFWQVSNAKHSQAYKTYPVDFIEKVNLFINR